MRIESLVEEAARLILFPQQLSIADYFESWHNLVGQFEGKTCFIVGSSSSLNMLPMEELASRYTFTANHFIPHGVRKWRFYPSFHCISYHRFWRGVQKNYRTLRSEFEHSPLLSGLPPKKVGLLTRSKPQTLTSPVFVFPSDTAYKGYVEPVSPVPEAFYEDNVEELHWIAKQTTRVKDRRVMVPRSFLIPRFEGVAVTEHLMVPAAVALGFKKLYMIGVDNNIFLAHFYEDLTDQAVRKRYEGFFEDRTHVEKGLNWQGKMGYIEDNMDDLIEAYYAKTIPEVQRLIPDDVEIYNCTPLKYEYGVRPPLETPDAGCRYTFLKPLSFAAALQDSRTRIDVSQTYSPLKDLGAWWDKSEGERYAHRWMKRFDFERPEAYANATYLKHLLKFSDVSSVLEVGCNLGLNLVVLERWRPLWHLEGCDISREAIEIGKEKTGFPLRLANITALPYEPRSFDLVFTFGVVTHIPTRDVSKAIGELQRVARKYVVMIEPDSRLKEHQSAWNQGNYAGRCSLFSHDYARILAEMHMSFSIVDVGHPFYSAFIIRG